MKHDCEDCQEYNTPVQDAVGLHMGQRHEESLDSRHATAERSGVIIRKKHENYGLRHRPQRATESLLETVERWRVVKSPMVRPRNLKLRARRSKASQREARTQK